jgi:FdhD protein
METPLEKPGITANTSSNESVDAIRCYKGSCLTREHSLLGEEPFLIRIEDHPYSVVMRTPGEEVPHAAGFCLAEGLVDDMDDFATIGFCEDMDPNVVDIRLQPSRRKKVSSLLERRGFISQTSCGICGKEIIEDICQYSDPVSDNTLIGLDEALRNIEKLSDLQPLRKITRSSHAVMLLDSELENLSVAEDVGRHNAFDKAIGKLFIARRLKNVKIAVLSSRISYEMIQKAVRARIPILLSASRPTALAVNLGKSLNMTLACTARESELIIFCGEERIRR